MIRSCIGCQTPFVVSANERNPRKWCSETCRVCSYRPRPQQRNCEHCDRQFIPDHARAIYCSVGCRADALRSRRRSRMQTVFACSCCGARFERPPVRGQRPKLCGACRHKASLRTKIPGSTRAEVYERDASVCQICMEPVDMDAPPGTDWAPSIDHVVCVASGGSNAAENLRLAHHWCNSVRSDGRAYSDIDFAAVA